MVQSLLLLLLLWSLSESEARRLFFSFMLACIKSILFLWLVGADCARIFQSLIQSLRFENYCRVVHIMPSESKLIIKPHSKSKRVCVCVCDSNWSRYLLPPSELCCSYTIVCRNVQGMLHWGFFYNLFYARVRSTFHTFCVGSPSGLVSYTNVTNQRGKAVLALTNKARSNQIQSEWKTKIDQPFFRWQYSIHEYLIESYCFVMLCACDCCSSL